jgi:transposase InsO family protein
VSGFIDLKRPVFGVEPICRALGVPTSTYYARRSRRPSARWQRDVTLLVEIFRAREGYRQVYGVRKTWHELKRRGVLVGREQVARLMRRAGLQGARRGRGRRTTVVDAAAERARDLVDRKFTASGPDQLWVADITYLRTFQGFCYLAFILDVYSRRVVGWQLTTHLRTDLVLDALEMAAALRRPPAGLVHHTDRGSQYTSLVYTDRLEQLGMAPSVGSRGDAFDNAMAEAFVGVLKGELVRHLRRGRPFTSFEQAEHELVGWLGFYNHQRLHGELQHVPPAEYERDPCTGPAGPPSPAVQHHEGAPSGLGTPTTETIVGSN